MNKKIIFITGTRADFGKLKPLLMAVNQDSHFTVTIFVTGMHMISNYGYTFEEVRQLFPNLVYGFVNQNLNSSLDEVLSKTIMGFSDFVRETQPDLIIVHGDRVEALAGAIVGSLNHILVAHIEGGEVSGTIDDSIRHAISKFSHVHFVSNTKSKQRLENMGEDPNLIHEIGSPDFDIMTSKDLPDLKDSLIHYNIPFNNYSILLFHPVTSEIKLLENHATEIVSAINESGKNFIVVLPNNDPGTQIIQKIYKENLNSDHCRLFPSIRFEHFLTILRNADMIIGNSSAGIREAPYFGIPTINIGTRQTGRSQNTKIINVNPIKEDILFCLRNTDKHNFSFYHNEFGFNPVEPSYSRFIQVLNHKNFWQTSVQKTFTDKMKSE